MKVRDSGEAGIIQQSYHAMPDTYWMEENE